MPVSTGKISQFQLFVVPVCTELMLLLVNVVSKIFCAARAPLSFSMVKRSPSQESSRKKSNSRRFVPLSIEKLFVIVSLVP